MKVVIVTLIKGGFPFIEELTNQLINNGEEVELFDMFDMYTVKIKDSKEHRHYHLKSKLLRRIFNIRFLGTILRLLFYKCYLILYPLKSDHITIHYVLPFYSFFINSFKKHSKSVSCCIWGSDFYRISDVKRNQMKPLLYKSDSIIIGNLKMADEFSNYYTGIFKKIKYVGFGIGKLDLIKQIKKDASIASIKESIALPENKLIITVGYNGIEAQQHLLILEAFEKLTCEIKDNIFVVIPFGYGGDQVYRSKIKNKLEDLNIDHIIFDNFISDEDVAKIRVATDFVINAQISDASSASIQEHLYSNNVLLAGEWLPYEYFINKEIKLWTFNLETLEKSVFDIINDFNFYSSQVQMNEEKIYNLSSWKSRINQWIDVFENKL